MRVSGIIHQQICQLKWHILACFGLIMVLPIEEALVNLKDGFGFQSSRMVIVSAMFAPLLAGLIACANVQGDLNDKLYIFWRSKPANVKLLITIKFFIGLIVSLVILVCPVAFGIISGGVSAEYHGGSEIIYCLPLSVLLTMTTYSLCFGCNVLVRSTARAWLIGLLLTGFLMVLPFMLPFGHRDFVGDIMSGMVMIYLVIMLVASVAAFMFSLFASQHDWHLRTNLKGLLWVVAGLVFVLLMLFSSQVANIKVLQEKESYSYWQNLYSLDYVGDRVLFRDRSFIDIDNNKNSLSGIYGSPDNIIVPITRLEGYFDWMIYPLRGRLITQVGDSLYSFYIYAYYRGQGKTNIYEKVYLRSYKLTGQMWIDVSELDISDCLAGSRYPRIAMRLIGNNLIALIENSCVVVDVTNPEELKLIDTKLDVLERRWYSSDRRKELTIPLVPIEEIGMEERIKLSIDWNYHWGDMYETSIADIYDETVSFFLTHYSSDDISRFEVTGWDQDNIYCEFKSSRRLTILEGMTGALHFRNAFVKNGLLYYTGENALMVFDVRSSRRIRKLGHFVRMDYTIKDIAVLEDGNILLYIWWSKNLSENPNHVRKRYLCLLKNPE